MKSHIGINETDEESIKYLREKCSTLIVPNEDERKFIAELYFYFRRDDLPFPTYDTSRFDSIPERFSAYHKQQGVEK
jgi:hypothetical protein